MNSITAEELLDQGLWVAFCKIRGYAPYSINEGEFSIRDIFILTDKEYNELGLVK